MKNNPELSRRGYWAYTQKHNWTWELTSLTLHNATPAGHWFKTMMWLTIWCPGRLLLFIIDLLKEEWCLLPSNTKHESGTEFSSAVLVAKQSLSRQNPLQLSYGHHVLWCRNKTFFIFLLGRVFCGMVCANLRRCRSTWDFMTASKIPAAQSNNSCCITRPLGGIWVL